MRAIHCSIFLMYLLLLGHSQELKAQRGVEELQKIVQFYRQSGKNLSFVVHYAYFENNRPKAEDTLSVRFTQNGSDCRMQGSDFEWLKIGPELLWIDHHLSQMALQRPGTEAGNNAPKNTIGPEQIAQMVKEQGLSVQSYQMAKKQAGLRITDPINPGLKIELAYDPSTHCLLKLTLEDEQQEEGDAAETHTRIVAHYSDYQIKKGGFPWTIKQFVSKGKNGLVPAKAFHDYKVEMF